MKLHVLVNCPTQEELMKHTFFAPGLFFAINPYIVLLAHIQPVKNTIQRVLSICENKGSDMAIVIPSLGSKCSKAVVR